MFLCSLWLDPKERRNRWNLEQEIDRKVAHTEREDVYHDLLVNPTVKDHGKDKIKSSYRFLAPSVLAQTEPVPIHGTDHQVLGKPTSK